MRKKKKTLFFEILVIATVVFAFMTAACINKRSMADEHLLAYGVTLAADILIYMSWMWLGLNKCFRPKKVKKSQSVIREQNCGIVITLAFCFITRLVQFGDLPRWDALQYYRMLMAACQNFDFSIQSYYLNFMLANHPTLGFASITAIGEFLNTGGYVGVLVVWLAVTLLAAFCLYRILEKMLPACSWIYYTLAACVIMSTPIVLGTFSYYQPDMGTICFFIFVIYCYLYKRNFLMFFSMLLLLLTKEIGIVVLGGFGLGMLIGRVIYTDKEKPALERVLKFFKEPLGISGLMAGCVLGIYLLYFLSHGGTIWQYQMEELEAFSSFDFQPAFILHKWKQFFILNFNWLIWSGNLLLLMISRMCMGKRKNAIAHRDVLFSIFFAAIGQIIFLSLYITFAFPRYQELIDFCGVALFGIQAGGLWPRRKGKDIKIMPKESAPKYVVVGLTGLLLFLEAYITIDPISLFVFENKYTGSSYIIREDFNDSITQADFTVYNHQCNYLTKVYNHVLKAAGYHEGMDVVIWSNPGNYAILEKYYWNTEKKRIQMMSGNSAISIKGYDQNSIMKEDVVLQEEAVFVLLPQFDISEESAEKFLNKYYEIRYKGSIDVTLAGKAVFYVCDLTEAGRLLK